MNLFSFFSIFTLKWFALYNIPSINGKFIYRDFNDTTGLQFVRSAGTTNCGVDPMDAYGDVQDKADGSFSVTLTSIKETSDFVYETTLGTNNQSNFSSQSFTEGFLNRKNTILSPKSCKTRLRLTPSEPSSTGAIWFIDSLPITNGFETLFTFQISDHSRECVQVKDQYFGTNSYSTCNVHGGDGFAFVIQNSYNKTNSIGMDGGQLGLGGIDNSLGITFDTWQNTDPGQDLVGVDNIAIHSCGVGQNSAFQNGLLGLPKIHPIADGNVHLVKIVYFNSLQIQYFNKIVASPSLVSYLKDNGEEKRVGTLAIFMDGGIKNDTPLFVIPINLSVLLHLPTDEAFVGFVSSTGKYFEKHDILSWIFCEGQLCEDVDLTEFDYHQQSEFSAVTTQFNSPGSGYGGDSAPDTFPLKNADPDSTPLDVSTEYLAVGRSAGLSGRTDQVPPKTLY